MAHANNLKLLELQQENESLSAAADEAAVMLEELARDVSSLRQRVAELEAHATVSAEIEAALRDSVQELSVQLADARVDPFAPSGHDIITALARYLPHSAVPDVDAFHALLHASAVRARASEACFASGASASHDAFLIAVENARNAASDALQWMIADAASFHERGSALLPAISQLEERLCAIISAFSSAWTESQALLKSAVIDKAVEAVRSCLQQADEEVNGVKPDDDEGGRNVQRVGHSSGVPRSVETQPSQSEESVISIDLTQISSRRGLEIRQAFESAELNCRASQLRADSAEASAAELGLSLKQRKVEIEDMAVRCKVFERQLESQRQDFEVHRRQLEADLSEKTAMISDLTKRLEQGYHDLASSDSVEQSAENKSWSLQDGGQSSLAETHAVYPSQTDSRENTSVTDLSADCLKDGACHLGSPATAVTADNSQPLETEVSDTNDVEYLRRLLAEKQNDEARLRRVMMRMEAEHLASDNLLDQRHVDYTSKSEDALDIQCQRKALSMCFRHGRRAAANARILKLHPVTMEVVDGGAVLPGGAFNEAINQARRSIENAKPVLPPLCTVYLRNGETDQHFSRFMLSAVNEAPQIFQALSFHEGSFSNIQHQV